MNIVWQKSLRIQCKNLLKLDQKITWAKELPIVEKNFRHLRYNNFENKLSDMYFQSLSINFYQFIFLIIFY